METHTYLEHANITVADPDATARFLTTALPHFYVRGEGFSLGRRWIHVGDQQTYVAFSQATREEEATHELEPDYHAVGFNHLGFVVPDADQVANNLRNAGFREGIHVDPHPHRKRVYFHDGDGIEWEFVEYLSEIADERNRYDQD